MLGISEELFWTLNPAKIEPYRIAYTIKEKQRAEELDYIGWLFGLYNERAFGVPLSQFASGLSRKKSDASYFDKPFSQQKTGGNSILPQEGEELSDEEKRRRTELLFASLNTMALNYKLEKGRDAK